MDRDRLIDAVEAALAFEETNVIVRSTGAVAEICGPLTVRQGAEWVTLGDEDGSHVHLKIVEVCTVRYREAADANAAIELLGADADVVCRISFQGTNPARGESYNRERAAEVAARFRCLAEHERT